MRLCDKTQRGDVQRQRVFYDQDLGMHHVRWSVEAELDARVYKHLDSIAESSELSASISIFTCRRITLLASLTTKATNCSCVSESFTPHTLYTGQFTHFLVREAIHRHSQAASCYAQRAK